MDSVLTLSAVDHGFDPWSDQTKDNKIDICCFSDDHSGWYGIRLIFRPKKMYVCLLSHVKKI